MNVICGVGTVPWLLLFFHMFHSSIITDNLFFNAIPLLIFVNGVGYHIIFQNAFMRYYDMVFNMIFIFYINLITKEKIITLFLSILSLLVFYCNMGWNSDIIHVLFVNMILMYPYMLCVKSDRDDT